MIKLTDVGLISHVLAILAYGILMVTALVRSRAGLNLWLAGAALASVAWAAAFVGALIFDADLEPWISRLQTVKIGAWVGLLLFLLRPAWLGSGNTRGGQGRSSFRVGGALGIVLALQLAVDFAGIAADSLAGTGGLVASLFLVSRISVAVSGLVLCHNLYVTTPATERSGLRLLAIGLGGLFVYDLNFYTLAFLLPPGSVDLYNIRGAVDAMLALIFLFASRDDWVRSARISRRVAFQTVAFSGVGFYLIAMALLAYGLKLVGGNWGTLLQVSFLFATLLLGVVVLVSVRYARVSSPKSSTSSPMWSRIREITCVDSCATTLASSAALSMHSARLNTTTITASLTEEKLCVSAMPSSSGAMSGLAVMPWSSSTL